MYTGVYSFIAVVTIVGVSIGFWLQGKLEASNQDVKLPSAFKNAA